MANGIWKGIYSYNFGRSEQFLLNKFFDSSTPSMRKVDDGEEKKRKKKEKTSRTEQGHTRVPSISFHFYIITINTS